MSAEQELLLLLNELKDPVIRFLEGSHNSNILDYIPHIISGMAVICSMIAIVLQYTQSKKLHERAEIYNTKKEAILEALYFLDTYISWLDMSSGNVPFRENTDVVDLTVKARKIHNRLCISCDNTKIIQLFVDLVVPDKKQDEDYPVFEKLNEFRNACRQELGYKNVGLPTEKIFLSQVSTRALWSRKNK